jgi:hypothetical protein
VAFTRLGQDDLARKELESHDQSEVRSLLQSDAPRLLVHYEDAVNELGQL